MNRVSRSVLVFAVAFFSSSAQPAGCCANCNGRRDDPTVGSSPSSNATARLPPPVAAALPAIAITRSIAGNCRDPKTPRARPEKILFASTSSAFHAGIVTSVSSSVIS